MPIEIRELHIKTVIDSQPDSPRNSQNEGAGGAEPDKELIVAACVEQVMEILKNKNER